MDEHKIPDLYHPAKPCPEPTYEEMSQAREVEIGPLCPPCPNHGNYPVRFYGATWTQNNRTGKVTVTQRHPALVMLNAN